MTSTTHEVLNPAPFVTHTVSGNQLTLLYCGVEYFPQLCAALDQARVSIFLESYIFARDETGQRVVDCLLRAARRGVSVHVLVDGFGAADFPDVWQSEFSAAGVHLQWFRREVFRFRFHRHRLRRLHRKLVAIDQTTAFIGGINIINDRTNEHSAPRLDYAVRVAGSMASEIYLEMRHLWHRVSWAKFRQRSHWLKINAYRHELGQQRDPRDTPPSLTLLLRDNFHHRRDIKEAYLHAITHAEHEIILANAYFLPGRPFRQALIEAAQRGVRVLLLLQGKIEYRFQHYATHALYGKFLEAGIEIYEYQSSYLHAKVAVIDGVWTTVGSSNIDPFSLMLAREANLVVRDREFAGALRQSLLVATEHAIRIQPQDWQRLNWATRLLLWASYAAVRIATGLVGGKRHAEE
ncbi:MAG: cardiolipin synthase ClsB [Gallionella sp.]|nr:cardiolipin synthase ClsB [Gallionella sp.]MDD4958197.1 cardiolipin synthase ClsB [Gallionella sp.]